MLCRHVIPMLLLTATASAVWAEQVLVVSGNENKIELTSGKPTLVDNPASDSLTIMDFGQFPPRIQHLDGIANTVIGPPSNLAILPGNRYIVLANSLQVDAKATPDPWRPTDDNNVHLIDIHLSPPEVVSSATAGAQPSGLSVSADGKHVLVANRADGSISVLNVDGGQLSTAATVQVCDADLSLSDVAIQPGGTKVIASVQQGGYLQLLEFRDGDLKMTDDKASVYGQPYRVVASPDGQLALTAGQGSAINGIDTDCLSVVDLTQSPPRTIDHVAIGAVPESIEISPDGQWVAAVLMAGSNFPPSDPRHSPHGQLVVMQRQGMAFEVVQRHLIGRIPEGVAFTSDTRYLLVQCHPDREIRVFRMRDGGAEDTGHRVSLPGMAASLRAAP